MPSFTAQVPNLQQIGPVVEVQITIGPVIREMLLAKGESVPMPVTALAMIDTGATKTVISKSIATALNLKPVGTSRIDTSSQRDIACYNYLVSLVFPNNVVIKETVVVGTAGWPAYLVPDRQRCSCRLRLYLYRLREHLHSVFLGLCRTPIAGSHARIR